MSQAWLNHFTLLHVLRDKTDKLDDKDIAKEFTERNERHNTTLDNFNCMFVLIIVLKNISMLLVREIACTQKCLKSTNQNIVHSLL